MEYVIGIDLGTSSVKVLLVNREGEVAFSQSETYPLIQTKPGYSEQDPEEWVQKTLAALKAVVLESGVDAGKIKGISFSGQMHGLVLLDADMKVVRPAILWNDTRTIAQCKKIKKQCPQLYRITKNEPMEGFTLPKLLWVKENEAELFKKSYVFLLPKDYVRFRLSGDLHSEYSDAAGTLLLDIQQKVWSREICKTFDIPICLCPDLTESHAKTGTIRPEVAAVTGLSETTQVFAGGADNACGAIGAGILSDKSAMCSIGTSGVFLNYKKNVEGNLSSKLHLFSHAQQDAFYAMGVTLSAGHSLDWFKAEFLRGWNFDEMVNEAAKSQLGSNGLLFTPYLSGERTPYSDAKIRGTFTGIDTQHRTKDFIRSILEGITFSINESLELFKAGGTKPSSIVSIGGGAKSDFWLQMQADIFDTTICSLENEQGPGMGAAMLAAVGLGWYPSLKECAKHFVTVKKAVHPIEENAKRYKELFTLYKQIYVNTKSLHEKLYKLRNQQ
ncbi:xylulokinase [Heyndrickxia acidiproducens]|uniref:xylulokinase n=1 Tax=Heyndrickxia acidiproducens TaxID=1121084 RepID=UPI000361583E|nr:xylulokinase [Heyndrickxia acidiproducens]